MARVQKQVQVTSFAPFNPLAKAHGGNSLDREQVSKRAYELFVARGGEHGHDLEDWLQAERELSAGRRN
jgi:hypothetical protein